MAAGDLITQDWQYELWRSDSDRLLMGRGTDYGWLGLEGFAVPDMRTQDGLYESRHGGFAQTDLLTNRVVRGETIVRADTTAALVSKLEALGAAFRPTRPGDAEPILTVRLPGARTVRCIGRPRRADFPQARGLLARSVKAGWEFVALDPRSYNTSEISKTVDLVAGQSSVSTTVVNIGDFPTDPVIEITGPATNPRIANQQDANRQIKIDITLTASDTLIVDVKNRTVTLAGVDKYGTVRTDNQWWELLAGANLITFSRTGTTGVARMVVKYRDAWVSMPSPAFDLSTISGLIADYNAAAITGYSGGAKLASWPNQVSGGAAATQTTPANQPWVSDRDYWLSLPGAAGAYASTPNDDANRTGNRLTKNQASLETSINGWVAAANCGVDRSTARASNGVASLRMVSSAAGAMRASTDGFVAKRGKRVFAGTQYTAVMKFRADLVPQNCQARINWYDAAGTFQNFSIGSAVLDTTTGWVQATVTANALANSAYALILPHVDNTAGAGEIHYVDEIAFHAGSSTVWTPGREEDLQIVVKVAANDYTPGSSQMFAGKDSAGRSWLLEQTVSGAPKLFWSTDGGTTNLNATATAGASATDGADLWIKATLDIDDGAGNRVIKFWTSADGATWAQLGATITTAGVTSVGETASAIEIGRFSGGEYFAGKVYSAEVRNQIDGTGTDSLIANPNFETANASGFSDDVANVWTLNGTASFGQSAVRAAEVRFNGIDEFLTAAASIGTVKHVIALAKYDAPTFANFDGLFTGVANLANDNLLVGEAGQAIFHNQSEFTSAYKFDGDTYAETAMKAPMKVWGVMSISRSDTGWTAITPQIGKDRVHQDRWWKGPVKRILAFNRQLTAAEEAQAIEELRRAA